MICTAVALCHRSGIFQLLDFFYREHGGLFTIAISFSCDEGGAKCAHDSCNVRTDYFTSRNRFQAAEYCVVIERSTLYDNVLAKL